MFLHLLRAKRLAILLAACCAPGGCHRPHAPTPAGVGKFVYPVEGSVFIDGVPAAGVFVLFYPEYEPFEPQEPRPRASVREDGSFALSTYGSEDGAPAGSYLVTFVWDPDGRNVKDLLNGRYADPARSKFKTVVLKGPNRLPPFHLNVRGGMKKAD